MKQDTREDVIGLYCKSLAEAADNCGANQDNLMKMQWNMARRLEKASKRNIPDASLVNFARECVSICQAIITQRGDAQPQPINVNIAGQIGMMDLKALEDARSSRSKKK